MGEFDVRPGCAALLAGNAHADDIALGNTIATQGTTTGADGQGQSSGGKPVFPALWGARSFNWGAGMGDIRNAADFVKANMPLGLGGTLTDQEAWDVATFMDSHERPQDPRFTGSVQDTRAKFHDTPDSMYGREVNGRVLGAP